MDGVRPSELATEDLGSDPKGSGNAVAHAPFVVARGEEDLAATARQFPEERHEIGGPVVLTRPRVRWFRAGEVVARPVQQLVQSCPRGGLLADLMRVAAGNQELLSSARIGPERTSR